MGNRVSFDGRPQQPSPLALLAVANSMELTREQLLSVQKSCTTTGGSSGKKKRSRVESRSVSRQTFHKAMKYANIRSYPDWEIIDQLYTMHHDDDDDDDDGKGSEERLRVCEFLAGISPLACSPTDDTIGQVLAFALRVYDIHNTKYISPMNLEVILTSINMTASYFGDRVLSNGQIHIMTNSVFAAMTPRYESEHISQAECVSLLEQHPMVEQLVLGLGQYKYDPQDHSLIHAPSQYSPSNNSRTDVVDNDDDDDYESSVSTDRDDTVE